MPDAPTAYSRRRELGIPTPRSPRLIAILVVALLALVMALPSSTGAASGVKVVVVVGPVGRFTAEYKDEARQVVAEARKYTSNVIALFTPHATWSQVKEKSRGASVFVYFGHGWGYPSNYAPFDGDRMNGMALDPSSGANGTRRVYYGENRVRASIRLAPGAAVLLYRLCYASGNTEPGLSEGTTSQSKRRVDGFGAGFLDTGAGIVFADGHPRSLANYVRQLFTTSRSAWQMFRLAPNFQGHVLGPYRSVRTPGARYAMDPDHGRSNPSGFYRSVVGNLSLQSRAITNRLPPPSPPPSETASPSPSPSETASPSPSPSETASPSPSPSETASPSPSPSETASASDTALP